MIGLHFQCGLFASIIFVLIFSPVQASVSSDIENEKGEQEGVKLIGFAFDHYKTYATFTVFILSVGVVKLIYINLPTTLSYIPESVLLIGLGILFGFVIQETDLEKQLYMSPTLFFNILLPPIILDASFSLFNRSFGENLIPILFVAVIGTALNFSLIGPTLYLLGKYPIFGMTHLNIPFTGVLLFSSIIVAIDPVAVLVIFQEIGVDEVLYFIVFGEALLNDAVTVVIYNIMLIFNSSNKAIETGQLLLGICSFFTVSCGGFFVGIVCGTLCCLTTRLSYICPILEPVFIFSFAYLSYLVGDILKWSGIMSMIGCGLMQAAYAFHNMTTRSVISVRSFSHMLSSVGEAVIFLFLGVAIVSGKHELDMAFVGWSLFLTLFVRTLVTFTLTTIINLTHMSSREIKTTEMIIMSYGGLRGAVSFSLAASINSMENGKFNKDLVTTTTLIIVLFTCIVMGCTMKPLVYMLNIRLTNSKLSLFTEVTSYLLQQGNAGAEAIIGYSGLNVHFQTFARLNRLYVRQFLQREPLTHEDKILKVFEQMSIDMTSAITHLPSRTATDRTSVLHRQSQIVNRFGIKFDEPPPAENKDASGQISTMTFRQLVNTQRLSMAINPAMGRMSTIGPQRMSVIPNYHLRFSTSSSSIIQVPNRLESKRLETDRSDDDCSSAELTGVLPKSPFVVKRRSEDK